MKIKQLAPGKYVVAVSGGVDSVVLLNLLSRQEKLELTVAHFDHGIRKESHEDEEFVRKLAKKYQLPFASERAELGQNASEEKAREARYEFLRRIATKQNASLVLAHHSDDVLETVIINLLRGTGWRGLSSLRSTKFINRPLLSFSKQEILSYAKTHNLQWREDSTNQDVKYLRNYVRLKLVPRLSKEAKEKLRQLQSNQVVLRDEIELAKKSLLANWQINENTFLRYPFIMSDKSVAIDLLKVILNAQKPQLELALLAIKTARPGAWHEVGGGLKLEFTLREFIVSRTPVVIS